MMSTGGTGNVFLDAMQIVIILTMLGGFLVVLPALIAVIASLCFQGSRIQGVLAALVVLLPFLVLTLLFQMGFGDRWPDWVGTIFLFWIALSLVVGFIISVRAISRRKTSKGV